MVSKKLTDYFKSSPVIRETSKRIPGISTGDVDNKKGKGFDLVYIVNNGRSKVYIAIEIAFQETSNSVIERKSAIEALFKQFNKKGYKLYFVIDGAGCFSRDTGKSCPGR